MTPIPLAAWVSGTSIILAVLAGTFALAWHGSIPGTAVVGLITTIVAGALGILGSHVGATRAIDAMRGGK